MTLRLREAALAVALVTLAGLALYPSLVRARVSSAVAQAIGDSRTVISANQTYASANCGRYAEDLPCMTQSPGPVCIPDYPKSAPEFLGGDLARPSPYVRYGYERKYQAFDLVEEAEPGCAPRSPRFACYASWPQPPWTIESRSFVALMSGEIFEDPYGGETGCVAIVTAGTSTWRPSANAHPFDSWFVTRVRAWEAFQYGLLVSSLFFFPTFFVVLLATLARRAVDSARALGACLAGTVLVGLLAPDALWFLVPFAAITAIVPKGPPRRARVYAYLFFLTLFLSVLAKTILDSLTRA